MTTTRRSRLAATAAILWALSAVPAGAGTFRLRVLPALALDRFAMDLGAYRPRLDPLDSRAYQELARRDGEVPDQARLTRFALLAGKFMGRGDLASFYGLRIRFKVVLE